ncbi:11015_t:CDS:10 [Acaulospora morrowiae]|uniref:11015_t:CDS:1 n=1 Tax=Acaulospora morrowiae TaxID=94023 RepID=A0A9N9CSH4_9GLOM|nr:11015_t:CDS:10 [Acaulospora morrowiae]
MSLFPSTLQTGNTDDMTSNDKEIPNSNAQDAMDIVPADTVVGEQPELNTKENNGQVPTGDEGQTVHPKVESNKVEEPGENQINDSTELDEQPTKVEEPGKSQINRPIEFEEQTTKSEPDRNRAPTIEQNGHSSESDEPEDEEKNGCSSESQFDIEDEVLINGTVLLGPGKHHESSPVNQSPEVKRRKQLDKILHSDLENDIEDEQMTDIEQEELPPAPILEGLCIECRDQEASFFCEQCSEDFCEVCFAMIHRTGKRQEHSHKPLNNQKNELKNNVDTQKSSNDDMDLEERSKYIPLRLNMEERKLLRLLEAALNVSEYTDKVDIISYTSKARRIVQQIRDLCSILSGLLLASDYKKGQELFEHKRYEDNEDFFQTVFEIGRRHKIMNPEKMRDAYGKLMYMLMDSVIPEVRDMLSFSLIKPIKTVYNFLKEHNGLDVLHDDHVADATKEIVPEGKSRAQINHEIRSKERAIEHISRKYNHYGLSSDKIKQCLYSIGDNHAYLRTNRDCCDRMLHHLTTNFHQTEVEKGYSLAIHSGRNGARLSHSHETQYCYAKQTLSLWREIQHEMFKLWFLADQDLLSEHNTYKLKDTGQGLNRIQNCPSVSKVMHSILHIAQKKAKYWVGSSVIHLGDKNVPNALMFIDKYNQVSRILNPILICLDQIGPLVKSNSGIRCYIENSFENVDELKKGILADFFRYAFDGSGADNFFDAGSCIDGRLTSAWNWCSLIEKKSYFPVFLLTGFVGFDGEGF